MPDSSMGQSVCPADFEMWRSRALFAEAQLGALRRPGGLVGRYVLHRCPTCNRVFSTPSTCMEDH